MIPDEFGIAFVRKLQPCKWRYEPPLDDGVEHFGFVAQEVDEIASHKKYGFVAVSPTQPFKGMLGLSMTEFIAPLTAAVKNIDKRLQEIEKKLNDT